MKILGVVRTTACYFDAGGLPIDALLAHTAKHGVLLGFSNQLALDPAVLLAQRCDVLVPAALERVIDAGMAGHLQCRVLAEGANGPTTPEADEVLNQRRDEIFVIPDILCNAGGVVVSYFEWVQDLQQFFWDEAEVMDKLYHVLDRAFGQAMARAEKDNSAQPDRGDGDRGWPRCAAPRTRAGCFREARRDSARRRGLKFRQYARCDLHHSQERLCVALFRRRPALPQHPRRPAGPHGPGQPGPYLWPGRACGGRAVF